MSASAHNSGLTPELEGKYVAENADAELSQIFANESVPINLQYMLVKGGYTTLRLFASLDDTREQVREALKTDFKLDKSADAATRLAVGTLINAWDSAHDARKREDSIKADARANNLPRPVTLAEQTQMKKATQIIRGGKKLIKDETPGETYISEKVSALEQNDYVASQLDDIVSVNEGDNFTQVPTTDFQGLLRIVRKKVKGSLPSNSEEYRKKMKIEGNLWAMLSTKYNNRPALAGITQQDFIDFSE